MPARDAPGRVRGRVKSAGAQQPVADLLVTDGSALEALLAGTGVPLYWFLVASSVGAGTLLLILTPLIRRLMHGVA